LELGGGHTTHTTGDLAWLESRSERGVLVLKFLVSRLDSKRHRKEDYHRVLTEAIAAGHNRIVLNFSNLGDTPFGVFLVCWSSKAAGFR